MTAVATSPGGDRRARRHAANKASVLRAAWDLARQRGLAAMSLSEIADRVDMRAPSLYSYFASKHAIYDAMFAEAATQFLDEYLTAQAAMPDDPRQRMRSNYHFFFDFCTTDPVRYLLLFQRTIPGFEPSADSYEAARQALMTVGADFASIGVSSGAADLDLITAVATGLVDQQISNDPGGRRWADLVDEAADMVFDHFSNKAGEP